ncbi:MAG TPA: asparagine synthase (glutamine-hydrolyzing) [Vicinamibacterales bacterium]|nr:asparagine synthase (glutamine-hydrolyzing) [Vicinamibacterales bacterium]
MCGIAGVMWWNRDRADRSVEGATRMGHRLAHRGPDGRGLWTSAPDAPVGVALAHTRLAIIDLSDGARQPMLRADQVVAYNGEIYNFREVRLDLESRGRVFSTDSDTEVLLHAWDTWGPDCLSRLTGMFAFAIWDTARHRLTLVRDRFGIKPLYVARTAGAIGFASEVRALLASGLIPGRIDASGVAHYLAFQTAPTPATLVDGVEMIPPGTWMTIDADGQTASERYWDLLEATRDQSSDTRATAQARVRELLEQSVRDHLVSDVPVGIFLSGGLDSTALLSVLSSSGVQAQTFTVGFTDRARDESAQAGLAAARFGAAHTAWTLTGDEIVDSVPAVLAAVDHPSGDGVNTFIVSRLVRAAGIKVAWSGLGGDELFGGYPSFARLRRTLPVLSQWGRMPGSVRSATAALVRRGAPASVVADKLVEAVEGEGSLASTWPVTRQLFGARDRQRLLARPASADAYAVLLADAAARHPGASVGALVSYAETRAYMHDVLLRDADQMSMAHGLEVRVPFVDHRLAGYLMSLPDAVRLDGPRPKSLLVESLAAPLPAALVDRPKRGFVLPFDAWMRTTLRPLVERRLGPEGLGGRGLFDAAAIDRLWQGFLTGRSSVTWARIWMLVALDAWIEHAGIDLAA